MSTGMVGLLSSTDHAMVLGAMKPSLITSSSSSSSHSCLSVSFSPRKISPFTTATRGRRISCEVAIKSDSGTSSFSSELSESPSSSPGTSDDETAGARIGARVRVKVPLKVYHVPKVPEMDVTGLEGELKQYVGVWKGKRISANLPYKVEFFTEVEGRGKVKFFAHLKDDEFEYV